MKSISRLLASIGIAGMIALSSTGMATAHDGNHPFTNCYQDAKDAGYSNIPKGDEHYGSHLDRDGDGYGCDKQGTLDNDGKAKTGYFASYPEDTPVELPDRLPEETPVDRDSERPELAETGVGPGEHPVRWLAASGFALALGAGTMFTVRRNNSRV